MGLACLGAAGCAARAAGGREAAAGGAFVGGRVAAAGGGTEGRLLGGGGGEGRPLGGGGGMGGRFDCVMGLLRVRLGRATGDLALILLFLKLAAIASYCQVRWLDRV